MNTETIDLPHGYTGKVATDDSPENPFKDWDCEMPIAVFHLRESSMTTYGEEMRPVTFLDHIPREKFASRTVRRAILAALPDVSHEDYARELACFSGTIAERAPEAFYELLPSRPVGWGEAIAYFDCMEALARVAEIPCLNDESSGYSQGHSSRVFAAVMPAWREKVGAPPENDEAALKATLDLYSAWAWGDVYGVSEILRPDGTEVEDASCWGFYGSDHEKSGLMEHCREAVEADLKACAAEAIEAEDAACRDIATVK